MPVGAGDHVAVDQRVRQVVRGGLELAGEIGRETAFGGFVDGAGVVGDQAAEHRVGVVDIAEVAGAVEGMEPGRVQAWGVADVVQPGGGRH